jgi:hypothetical protein
MKVMIDGAVLTVTGCPLSQVQVAILDLEIAAGRQYIDVIALDRHTVLHLSDRHTRNACEYLAQHAFVMRRQVKHEHERHARVRRHGRQQLLGGVEPACRSANANYPKRQCRGRFLKRGRRG